MVHHIVHRYQPITSGLGQSTLQPPCIFNHKPLQRGRTVHPSTHFVHPLKATITDSSLSSPDDEEKQEAASDQEVTSITTTTTTTPSPQDPLLQQQEPPPPPSIPADVGTIWGLAILSLAYLHHSTTGFALPALLPIVAEDLHLEDSQGALLTAGYTVLYALTLVPMGLLADRVDRPRLLSAGIAAWSILTVVASRAGGFGELLITRIGFAAAQATQNPICFSLIPELFPKSKTAAMGIYNTAIYAGRALSFAAVILAAQLGVPQMSVLGEHLTIGYTLVPLDKVDLTLVSVLYTQGDYAAVSPIYSYADDDIRGGNDDDGGGVGAELQEADAFGAWRKLLRWLGPPGLVIAMLTFLTIDEPRNKQGFVGNPLKSSRFFWNSDKNISIDGEQGAVVAASDGNGAIIAVKTTDTVGESLAKLRILLSTPAFLALTLAATFNDVGSWSLVAWQATFYQRVYDLQPDTYAPLLAVVIPVGGIIGGVGAGVLGDWLFRIGARGWLTAGACLGAAPFIAMSLLAPDYKQSFAALLVGFALSEAWRAPAAVMVRDVSPPGLGSAASAAHLCIRNLIGGLGPIAVALLSGKVGLQLAMLLVPVCYIISGVGFLFFESAMAMEKSKEQELLE